jgi:23S rRNA pseudouridine1911/1915/1917 synthase
MTGPQAGERVFIASAEEAGSRLDRVLVARLPELSRSRLQALVRESRVQIDGRTIGEPGHRVKPGDAIAITVPEATPPEPVPEAIPLHVVHEDESLIVIDKPAGLVVHPAAGHATGTLVNALIAHCGKSLSGIGGVRRPGIVHRLDKDTSGLLVVAKTDRAHKGLSVQFAAHGRDGRLVRSYLALVWGRPMQCVGRIEAALGRSTTNRKKIAIAREGGRMAVTHYEMLRTFAGPGGKPLASLLACRLETGRTHQVRVHLASIGHPLLGDRSYGSGFAASARNLPAAASDALDALGRQALHAAELGFEHPVTKRKLHFQSEPPADLAHLLATLGATSA